MTDTGTDIEALAREVAEYLRSHRTARPVVNQAGQPVGPSLLATGRLVVNPGDEIQSVWGNTTYDQTAQVYLSAADRDSQWTAPHDGAVCYLLDSQSPWVRRSGAWFALPLGKIASATGPASQTDISGTLTTVVSLSVNLVGGRVYRVTGYASGQQVTNTTVFANMRLYGVDAASIFLYSAQNMAVGTTVAGTAVGLKTAATSVANATFTLQGNTSAVATRYAPNSCSLFVEDIGGI
jgi:hypothetical protein